jgi:ubiquinone/menaquinone biosynthesis C-methylase UbiE
MKSVTTVQEREAEFWDAAVDKDGPNTEGYLVTEDDLFDRTMPWLGYMDFPAFVSDVFEVAQAGSGRRILDLGCGKGFLAIALAHRGSQVTAIDISPKSVELARLRAEAAGVADKIDFQVMDCENLDFGDDTFDAVVGSFVLHHLNLEKVSAGIKRVLRPQGGAAFIETIGMNPLLMLARATLPGRFGIEKASSDDEAPLDPVRINRIKNAFEGDVRVTFPRVVFFRMGGYLSFLDNTVGRGLLKALDQIVGAIGMRRASYYGVVVMCS